MIASIFTLAATAFLEPNEDALVRFIVLTSIFTFCNAAINVIVPSMMADIADYGTWKFRENRGATYFSSYSLMLKTCVGLGVALGLGVAGLFNFDSTTTTHTVENIFGLRLAFAYIPALLMLVSLPLVVKNPINARRHGIVQHQLEQRMQRNQKSTDKNGLISIDKEDCVSLEAS